MRASLRRDRQAFAEGITERAEQAAARGDWRAFFADARALAPRAAKQLRVALTQDPHAAVTQQDLTTAIAEFSTRLHRAAPAEAADFFAACARQELPHDAAPPTAAEAPAYHDMLRSCATTKRRKGCGVDGVPPDLQAECPREAARHLWPI
eukprot:685516-Lingulodinium_polyedra.AAC.1